MQYKVYLINPKLNFIILRCFELTTWDLAKRFDARLMVLLSILKQ